MMRESANFLWGFLVLVAIASSHACLLPIGTSSGKGRILPGASFLQSRSGASILTRRRCGGHSSVGHPLFSSSGAIGVQNENDSGGAQGAQPRTFSKRVWGARAAVFLAIFSGGYKLYSRFRGPEKTASLHIAFLRFVIVTLLARDVWRMIPPWAKPGLITRAVADTKRLIGMSSAENIEAISGSEKSNGDNDNITNFATLTAKMNKVVEIARRRLPEDKFGTVNVQASFLALLNILQQEKEQDPQLRDNKFASCSIPDQEERVASSIVMSELADWMDLADAAYNELPNDETLQDYLKDRGYQLLKHSTNVLPGTLGHYVALDQNSDTALIAIKGTSNLEDMITDLLGAATEFDLDGPFWKDDSNGAESINATTKIRAHEGVLLSSRRLAEDLRPLVERLLLPQGYKIVVIGHSLGAAAAALLAVLLQSQLPELQGKIYVYAFASPPSLDLASARACKPFCTTIVNNADAIPRCNAGPMLVTMEVLKAVQDRLLSRQSSGSEDVPPEKLSSWRLAWQYLRASMRRRRRKKKKDTGTDEEDDNDEEGCLMTPDELSQVFDDALEAVGYNDDDPDQLYVPGDVIMMYNSWEDESDELENTQTNNGEKHDYSADRLVLTNPTAKVLRYLEPHQRMVEDHMAPSYKSSLRTLANSTKAASTIAQGKNR